LFAVFFSPPPSISISSSLYIAHCVCKKKRKEQKNLQAEKQNAVLSNLSLAAWAAE
jgi:hypothetical protein